MCDGLDRDPGLWCRRLMVQIGFDKLATVKLSISQRDWLYLSYAVTKITSTAPMATASTFLFTMREFRYVKLGKIIT